MTEDHPFNNENFYGATKIAGEAAARAYHHRYGLPYVGLRYMNVYGPRQGYQGAYIAVIMKMLDAIDRGQPLTVYGDGSQAYDFVYVGDCGDANVDALKADTVDRFYNVGTGCARRSRSWPRPCSRSRAPTSGSPTSPRPTFVKNRIGSAELAEEELGFAATVGLEEGLQQLVHWRRGHLDELERRRERADATSV